MKTYHFPFWRKQFYFHLAAISDADLLAIYEPYSLVTKLIWKCWKRSSIIRKYSASDTTEIVDTYNILKEIISDLDKFTWAINLGNKGLDQKITILLRHKTLNENFFFVKVGKSTVSMSHISNEIAFLKENLIENLTPTLYHFEQKEKYAFLITHAFAGKKIRNPNMSNPIFDIACSIVNQKELYQNQENKLIYSFNHGDFCPWNVLEVDNNLKVIDWEAAGFYPLGYDLFTYIFQTSFLLKPKIKPESILLQNKNWIDRFFSSYRVDNWHSYLSIFATIKKNNSINDIKLISHFTCLENLCQKN
jgi:hypothetical protein